MLLKSVLIATVLVLSCSGCAMLGSRPAASSAGTPDTSYLYKGDLTRDGGTNCFYYCF
jgi:hypothetical protein